jgi:hypothetical protein
MSRIDDEIERMVERDRRSAGTFSALDRVVYVMKGGTCYLDRTV